ncbi:MAG: hypothetical protein IBX39_04625 [Candidatus Methanoperedenaceae archaeon]|nr:hypothetical protein [Candidatus Methanoperedenaceae archaeon]
MDKLDDSAIAAGIDLMIALVLMIAAVTMAILIMPSMSHEDKSWRINQYMAATRASDNLVQDEGQEGWVDNWKNQNYQNVTKIGFVYAGQPKVLNETKIDAMMMKHVDNITEVPWWEFPNFTSDHLENEKKYAARALGLEEYDKEYNFYMRLYPVGLGESGFNYSRVEINLSKQSKVPMNENTASMVDRYVYINSSDASCKGGYICYDNKTVHYRLNLWVWW